jgi:hypothetical protein
MATTATHRGGCLTVADYPIPSSNALRIHGVIGHSSGSYCAFRVIRPDPSRSAAHVDVPVIGGDRSTDAGEAFSELVTLDGGRESRFRRSRQGARPARTPMTNWLPHPAWYDGLAGAHRSVGAESSTQLMGPCDRPTALDQPLDTHRQDLMERVTCVIQARAIGSATACQQCARGSQESSGRGH